MSEIESIIDDLLDEESNIFGVGIISKAGTLITQLQSSFRFLFSIPPF